MKKLLGAVAVIGAAAIALSGCSASATGSQGSKAPIVVGSVNALSGPATFPEASAAAKAVFDQVNAEGGIQGRKIQYTILDDKGDPATAASDARKLVSSNNAVALVGSASLLECEVNGAYYTQQGIVSIQGTGVDPGCFSNPNIAPVNVGPYGDTQMTLTYGSEVLGLKKICALVEVTGDSGPAYLKAIDAWSKATGKKMAYVDDKVPYGGSDYTPYLVKAKAAGCDAIYSNAVEPDAIGQLKAAAAQGMSGVTFLYLTSVYSAQFAKAAGTVGKGVYVPAEFTPYTDPSNPANAAWQSLMTKNNIALTSFGQGGYLAAEDFVQVLKSIKGDITRDSVTKAFKGMTTPISNKMTGTPWIFGSASAHNPNQAGFPIKLLPGSSAWASAATEPIVLK